MYVDCDNDEVSALINDEATVGASPITLAGWAAAVAKIEKSFLDNGHFAGPTLVQSPRIGNSTVNPREKLCC
jgi:hypothetical protein